MTAVTISTVPLRARKKLETRERILDVAVRMFGDRGLEAPTVEEIAEAAGVGKGTIYNYFQSKEEMVVAFMVDVERKLQAKAKSFAQEQGPLEGILERYIRYHLALKEPYRDFIAIVLSQLFARDPRTLAHLHGLQTVMDPPLLEWLGVLQKRGLIRPDVELPRLVQIFKSVHFGIVVVWLNDSPPYRETKRWLKEEMRLFSQGLASKGGGSRAARSRRPANGRKGGKS